MQVRHILQLVADNTGFLVEDRLLTLIAKYPLTSRNLCTLDAIFMVKQYLYKYKLELSWISHILYKCLSTTVYYGQCQNYFSSQINDNIL